MGNIKKYASRLAVGFCIGLAVWAGMGALVAANVVASGSLGAMASPVYTGLFFGVIQAASAVIDDVLDNFKDKKDAAEASKSGQCEHRSKQICQEPQLETRCNHAERLQQKRSLAENQSIEIG